MGLARTQAVGALLGELNKQNVNSVNSYHCRPKSHFRTILKTTKSRLPVSTAATTTTNGSDRSFRNEANLKLTNYTNLSTTNFPSNESLSTKSEPDSQLATEWNKRNFVKNYEFNPEQILSI